LDICKVVATIAVIQVVVQMLGMRMSVVVQVQEAQTVRLVGAVEIPAATSAELFPIPHTFARRLFEAGQGKDNKSIWMSPLERMMQMGWAYLPLVFPLCEIQYMSHLNLSRHS
jgi:hypothetical protein